jgi:protein SCO1/2
MTPGRRFGALAAAAIVALALFPASAEAQRPGFTRPAGPNQLPSRKLQEEVGYAPRLGESLPLDVVVTDETGARRDLASFFTTGRPVMVAFYYQSCPMLCSLQLESLVSSIKGTKFLVGRDFDFLAVSFDPQDDVAGSARAKEKILQGSSSAGAPSGFHFVTADAAALDRLTAAAGFRYYWEDATNQWAHASGALIATRDGRMARFLPGIEPFPRDLQFALIESSEGRIGTLLDRAILYCYQYNPESGQYGAAIMRTLRLAAVATVIGLAGFVIAHVRREKTAPAGPAEAPRA